MWERTLHISVAIMCIELPSLRVFDEWVLSAFCQANISCSNERSFQHLVLPANQHPTLLTVQRLQHILVRSHCRCALVANKVNLNYVSVPTSHSILIPYLTAPRISDTTRPRYKYLFSVGGHSRSSSAYFVLSTTVVLELRWWRREFEGFAFRSLVAPSLLMFLEIRCYGAM